MTRAQVVGGRRIEVVLRPGVARLLPVREIAAVVSAALDVAGAATPASITVVLTDDAELAELNRAHLGHAGPTDVLSFPLLPPAAFPPAPGKPRAEPAPPAFSLPPGRRPHLGDIAISVERARAQAEGGRGGQTGDVRWAPADELRLLLTHGALHICGWDHAAPEEEAAMRALEDRLLDGRLPDGPSRYHSGTPRDPSPG